LEILQTIQQQQLSSIQSLCGMEQPTIILILTGTANHHSDSDWNSFSVFLGFAGTAFAESR
jgi:hypothetical protein